MPSVDDYFQRHLWALRSKPLLRGYETYSARCAVLFKDRHEGWCLTIEQGCIRQVDRVATCETDVPVRFVVEEPVFWDMVKGRISPQQAFFARRTDIKGDLFEGMKLAKLLSLFFLAYPYRELSES